MIARVLLAALVIVHFVAATSVSVFDVQTTEANQLSILLGSGIRPTVGWTTMHNGTMSMTLAVKSSTTIGWVAVGISTSDGLGTSVMYGGKGGGAIIGRFGVVTTPAVAEYSLTGPNVMDTIVYDTTPISLNDVTQCLSTFCQQQVGACLTQPTCANALKCVNGKYANITTALNESSSLATIINYVSDCASPLENVQDPGSLAGLSAILDGGSCFVSSCTQSLLTKGIRIQSLNSSSLTNDGTTIRLSFVLNNRFIAGVPFDPSPTTLMVAIGPTGAFQAHSMQNAGFADINIDTGLVTRELPQPWLMAHVALEVIGFGILLPLALILRSCNFQQYSSISLIVLCSAITFASVGGVVVSSYLTETPSPTDPHAIIGIICLFFVCGYLIVNLLQPINQTRESGNAWHKVTMVGMKKQQMAEDDDRDCSSIVHIVFRIVELMALASVAGSFVTGLTTVQGSTVLVDPALEPLTIICIGLCIGGLIASYVIHLCKRRRRFESNQNKSVAESSPSSFPQSPNPGYSGSPTDVDSNDMTDIDSVPLYLTWEKVGFNAKIPRAGAEPKQILKGAIGYCAPRTLTAVLGPSGAGKSTLMEILALRSRVPPTPDSRLWINGTPAGAFPGIHRLMGYVPQQDVLHEFLTVLETLQFTCKMILPEEMSEHAKVDRMLRVVAQLGIGHILDTRVGGSIVRGLSGGERRRISIALQMLKSPSILFLDEPTSGLDAHLALRLCKVLRELANEGRTIFATIHQPSAACFELFDRVILLSGGYTVYSGTRTGALNFFRDIGRDVPLQWNPADWLLTVIDFKRDDDRLAQENGQTVYQNNKETEETLRRRGIVSARVKFRAATSISAANLDVSELRDNVRAYYQQVNPSKLDEGPGVIEDIVSFTLTKGLDALDHKLKSRYKVSILPFFKQKTRNYEPATFDELLQIINSFASSRACNELVESIRSAKQAARASIARLGPGVNAQFILQRMDSTADTRALIAEEDARANPSAEFPQNFMSQTRLLSRRQIILVWRNPQALRFQAFQNIVFGLLLGALYSNIRFLKTSPFQETIVMAIILAMVAFVTLSLGTQVAFSERLVLEREMSDTMYSPLAHFISRLVIGIPVAFFIALCLIIPAYFWVGLTPTGQAFFFFCLVNAAVVFLFDSVVFALTLLVTDVSTAYAVGNFYEAITIFFSGVFIPIYAMPVFFRWLYFLSPFSYAFAAVVVNEFQGSPNDFTIGVSGVIIQSAWPNLLILFAMGVGWRFIGLIGIIRLFRQKRPGGLSWHLNKHDERAEKPTLLPINKTHKYLTSPGV